LKNSPVLILDEATSHLDAVNERQVRQALETLMVGRTTVVIAHRLSTIRDADRIVVLDNGHAVEQGNHHDLLASHGLYSQLVATQLVGATAGRDHDGHHDEHKDDHHDEGHDGHGDHRPGSMPDMPDVNPHHHH
jgi:ABC-type multidrug transport system ATPase subunit